MSCVVAHTLSSSAAINRIEKYCGGLRKALSATIQQSKLIITSNFDCPTHIDKVFCPSSLTITVGSGRIEGVPCSATVQANASVGSDGVVATLVLQALVVINLALVHVCQRELSGI